MQKHIKAALLSGLVLPGLGQVVLGKRWIGSIIIILTGLGVACLVYSIVLRFPFIIDQLILELEHGMVEMPRIVEITIQSSKMGNSLLEISSTWLVVLCWAGSIIHALLAGRKHKA